jgi:hypothetical protein
MQNHPVQEEHFGTDVWVNSMTEGMRDQECLCLHCDNLNPGSPNNCSIAQELYEACLRHSIALTLTRCPDWKPKSW